MPNHKHPTTNILAELEAVFELICTGLVKETEDAWQRGEATCSVQERLTHAEEVCTKAAAAIDVYLSQRLQVATDQRSRELLNHQRRQLKDLQKQTLVRLDGNDQSLSSPSVVSAMINRGQAHNAVSSQAAVLFTFVVYMDDDSGAFHFKLVTIDGQSRLKSAPYATEPVAYEGVRKVMEHAPHDRNYVRKRLSTGWSFHLQEANKDILAIGEAYSSIGQCEEGIAEIQRHASVAEVRGAPKR